MCCATCVCYFVYRPGRGERALTQREDLPQQDAVGPHVALRGEHLVKDGLWRHPLEREAGLSANQRTAAELPKATKGETLKVLVKRFNCGL